MYIPEGEKDVLSLVRLGLVATCNPGGAGKWRDEYSARLQGADLILLPVDALRGELDRTAEWIRVKETSILLWKWSGISWPFRANGGPSRPPGQHR